MLQPNPRRSDFLKIPRRIWLRWLSLYFILFSLILLVTVLVLVGGSDGALSALTGMALGIVALTALVNLGLGGLGLLLSFWKRRRSLNSSEIQWAAWPRHRGLRLLYQASLSLVSAAVLYVGIWVIGILTIGFVLENAMGWWYGWRMPQVNLGDAQQQVEQIVGRGTFRTECSSTFAQDYSRATDLKRCVNLVLYYQGNGGRWELGYDAENRVVSKQYVKP